MADFTTTTNLSLKKPAIGGSSDKWGEYLNENMETIGTSIVNLQNASTSRSLESLSNVLDTTPTTGQLLQYDTANWKAATVTIPDNIQDLANVTITTPSDGQVLAWSNSNSRWENQTPGAATIPDGTITTAKLSTSLQGQVNLILQTTGAPTDNQILRYDSTSTNWQFEDLPGGTVSALSDTDVSAIANKDVLVYNSTSGNWVSRPLAIADVTNLQTSLDAKLESSDISVSALSDTTITSTVDDSFLVYDSADSKWKNEGPSTVRSTLSLVVGTNVQAFDQGLSDIAGLSPTDAYFIVGDGSNWVSEAPATARASLGLGALATQDTITESQIFDLGSYITASSTDTLTNKSGNISQWTNDAGYLTAETNDLTNVSGTLGTGNGGTGLSAIGTANQVLAVNTGATALEFQTISITESQISDLQSYLTAETNDLSAAVTWANVPDANITQSSVTQHQAALSITESQISDLQTYLTAESNDLSSSVTWANVPDANITQSSVTQHQAALSITESQISDLGTYLTAETNDLGSTVTGTLGTANGGTGLTTIGTAGQVLKVNSGATALEFADESGGGGSGSSYIEHSSTVSDSLAISSGTNRMYVGNTTFSGSGTMAGYLVISHGYANFTSASALNITGTLNVI